MIDRLLAARVPIMLVMVKLQETGSTLPLTLSEEEWKVLKDLSGILSLAKEVLTLEPNCAYYRDSVSNYPRPDPNIP